MPSITIYKAASASPGDAAARRRDGMIEAGARLRDAFVNADSNGSGKLESREVEAAANATLVHFANSPDHETLLEHDTGGVDYVSYRMEPASGGKFRLVNKADETDDRRKLRVTGRADDFDASGGGLYTMTTVAPETAVDFSSWDYLWTVYEDLEEINKSGSETEKKTNTVNYLIATFAFTRCR